MKKLVISLLIAFISINAIGQYSIKGYTLGSKYTGKLSAFEKKNDVKIVENQTVAGIKGALLIEVLPDRTIPAIYLLPDDRLYSSDLNNLIAAIERKFNIELDISEESGDITFTYHEGKDKGLIVFGLAERNRFMDRPYKLTFFVADAKLREKMLEHKKSKAAKDI